MSSLDAQPTQTFAPRGYDAQADARHQRLRQDMLLEPDVAFLNHGSFGACARPVFERYQAWQLELERQPVAFLGRRLRDLLAEARGALAGWVGADTDELVYFPNVTSALNVVAQSLELSAGDEILTTDHEYGALERTWTYVAERRGARLVPRQLPLPLNEPAEVVEAIWGGVTPRTRVLFLSHITSPTGVRLPIEPLVQRARQAGLWTIVDGAHAPGQVPLDLHQLGVDFYGANCHKWLGSPKGAGFLYVRRELQPLIKPPVISWGWRPLEPGPSRFVDELEQRGTTDPAAALSVPAAIAYQVERDWPRVRQECQALVLLAHDRLLELLGTAPLVAPAAAARWLVQMAAVPLPADVDAAALKQRLYDEHRVEVPVMFWQQPLLRVSVQGYVTHADVERLLQAVDALLPTVRRASAG